MDAKVRQANDIATLVSQCPHTAADYLPLVMWMDVMMVNLTKNLAAIRQ